MSHRKNEASYEYLSRYNSHLKKISLLADEIYTLKSYIEHPQGSGLVMSDRGASSCVLSKDLLFNTCLDIQVLEEEYNSLIEEAKQLYRSTEHTINICFHQSKNVIEKLVLEYTYLYGISKSQLLHDLGLQVKQYEYYHKKGLEIIETYLIQNNIEPLLLIEARQPTN
jgi:hypothetical protein